ncbi:MAG: HlyD family efflux transporter periplasmic adaptor subunit [Leptolyngbyaceae cyanobacterium SM1_4_3]|nr:HlyD family efflux transporter periplasmic adaptor subunit [Leptolyngbyaceae cyanobacterium SM1_4_3]
MSFQLLSKPSNRWIIILIVAASALTGGIIYYGFSRFTATQLSPESAPVVSPQRIVALGRLEPQQEVIKVSVPSTLTNDRITRLLVQRGDRVQAGQVIAILDSRDRLQGALAEAEEQVRVTQSKLVQVRAGARAGEIAAQEATITRLQAELDGEIAARAAEITRRQAEVNNARAEYDRYRSLYQSGAISALDFDQRRLTLETAQAQLREAQSNQSTRANSLSAQLQEARANLDRIAEVRPVDVQVAQTEVGQAIAALERTKAELAQAEIRAPMSGQILEIYARPGEVVGTDGIVDLGQTDQMQVVAEVYQSDIKQVQMGRSAIVTGDSFDGELRGTVDEIGLQVNRQEVFNDEPGENLDQRVIKVRIRLAPEDSQRVAKLTNLQVQVAIGSGGVGE